MADDSGSKLDFAALDALLDRALDLDAPELAVFLEGLEPSQRTALTDLLRRSNSGVLDRLAERVRDCAGGLAEDATRDAGRAGDWHLKREIGSGGTGQVFYAERRDPQEPADADGRNAFVQRAAVKVLWSHRVASQFRDRFLRERRILASIDHPGLARFLDGGLLGDGRPWFAMEYVEGSNIIDFAKGLPLDQRLKLFIDIADTIDYAHQRLIVHRDIKPQNILVDAMGRPRVLDFGIARILGDPDEQHLTRLLGTPVTLQYASPEQVTGGAIDVASDVYQLGLLLYELLTDTRPYRIDESSLQAAIDTICTRVPPPPSARNAVVEADLDAIVAKSLGKSPRDRYASAAALSEDVRRYVAGRPIAARAPSRWYVLRRFLRRHALPASILAVSVVALSVATVFSLLSARHARAEAERSQTTRDILAAVFEQADPFGANGANVTLADALVRARASIDERVADDPRLAWEVNKTLAGIFGNLDMPDREREAFQAAWNAALELEGDNESELLFAIAGLGNILAREDPGKAAEFLAKHLPARPAKRRSALSWLSAKYAEVSAYSRLRDFPRADSGARAMDEVARTFQVESPRTLSRIDQLLAGAAQRAGDAASADEHWSSAVAHMRRAENPRGLAVTLSNQALHFGRTERFARADELFRESIAIFQEHAPRDSSHANVQRLYAGLLFRMRRGDEALEALRQALSILDPGKQGYEYFVAQVERANFSFALGELEVALDAIEHGIGVAAGAFGPEAGVTQRMVPVLARMLLFADRPADAARLLSGGEGAGKPPLCEISTARGGAIDEAIRVLADEGDVDAVRRSLWAKVDEAAARSGDARAISNPLTPAIGAYEAEPSVFLDVLDRYRLLTELKRIGERSGLSLPAAQAVELERMERLREGVKKTLARDDGARLARVWQSMRVMSGQELSAACTKPARHAVVSQGISR